jgi:hypothetical protein
MPRRTGAWSALLVLALVAGCGRGDPRPPLCRTTGKLVHDGKPAVGALVLFHPATRPSMPFPPPRARSQAGGVFTVETYESADGLPEGDYIVTVDWHTSKSGAGDVETDVKSIIPDRYMLKDKSTLRATVRKGADGACDLGVLKLER